MKPITHAHPTSRLLTVARRLVPLLVIAGLAGGGWYGWRWWRGGTSAVTYTTTAAERGRVVQSITASGTLSPVVRSTVGSQVSGRITEILVDFNDHVTKGQVLARLDKRVLAGEVTQANARLTSARADLARAQATAANARLVYDRAVAMLAQGVVAVQEVEADRAAKLVADAAIQGARASIVDAQAALANATTNLAYTTITAPIDGVIISRSVDAGQTVAASLQAPELFVIANDLTKMELHAAVAEADVGQLVDGTKVELAFDAFPERTFTGVVRQVRNQAVSTQNVVTYDAVVAVDNADGALRPGMTATATFVVAEAKDVLVVSAKALRYRPVGARTATGAARGSGSGSGTGAARGSGSGRGVERGGGSGAGSTAVAIGAPSAAPGARRGPSPAVWVLRAGAPVRVPVVVGLSDGTQTAITGGELHEGDLVISADSSTRTATPGATAGSGASRGGSRQGGPPPLF